MTINNKIKILAVLPYEGLRDQILKIAGQYDQIEVKTIVTKLNEAVENTKAALKALSYDAIISRGGTAETLRSDISDIEIIDIPVTFADVFRAVLMVRNYTEKFAIQSFPTIAKSAENLCRLLQYDIDVYTIHSPEESLEQLKTLRENGYTMVVGDMTTSAMAKEAGMNVTLITSGEDSIKTAIDRVILFEKGKETARKEWTYLNAIQSGIRIYITAYTEEGIRVFSNDPDQTRFPKLSSYIEKNRTRYIEEEMLTDHCRLNKELYTVHSEKIGYSDYQSLTVIFGRKVEETIDDDDGIEDDGKSAYSFRSNLGVANSVGETREIILSYCNVKEPILIMGESGCGKDQAAASLHQMSENRNRPYCVIDFAAMTPKEWNRFFKQHTSPLMDINCTIYLKNIQNMNREQENAIIDQIENSNLCRRNRIILSGVVEAGEEACSMARYMLEKTTCILLQALPLRKRREDIMNLCTIYLSEFNVKNGTQIIGLDERAQKTVMEYSWPGNVTQLKRVLRESALMTSGDFITDETISKCIYNEAFESERIESEQINLNQSLDDITYDLVRMIMKEEKMNRQRTADRLKISRTTLWRILRSREPMNQR